MMSKARTQFIANTDTVALTATFKDAYKVPIDTDTYPRVSIMDPTGAVALYNTSAGVSRISTGKYQIDFFVNIAAPQGVWVDNWSATINGTPVDASFQFVVSETSLASPRLDGYEHLGDDIPYDYSQVAIRNINKLLKTLRARLRSRGKVKAKDAYGNDIYITCDIYDLNTLLALLGNSLSLFNEVPHFTLFTFDDTPFVDQFHDLIVEGAVMNAMQSQALLETGLNFQISDSGVGFTPPNIGEMLNTQFNTLYGQLFERIKFIKNSFKPFPMGLGRFNAYGSDNNPAWAKMRHLRQRQIY